MENARCSIELGNSRFVQVTEWKDEIRIDIREWEIMDGKQIPTKKGSVSPYMEHEIAKSTFFPFAKYSDKANRRILLGFSLIDRSLEG